MITYKNPELFALDLSFLNGSTNLRAGIQIPLATIWHRDNCVYIQYHELVTGNTFFLHTAQQLPGNNNA